MAAFDVVWSWPKNPSPNRQSSDRNPTVRQRFVPSLGLSLSVSYLLVLSVLTLTIIFNLIDR